MLPVTPQKSGCCLQDQEHGLCFSLSALDKREGHRQASRWDRGCFMGTEKRVLGRGPRGCLNSHGKSTPGLHVADALRNFVGTEL